jgi:hypothetical protein
MVEMQVKFKDIEYFVASLMDVALIYENNNISLEK